MGLSPNFRLTEGRPSGRGPPEKRTADRFQEP